MEKIILGSTSKHKIEAVRRACMEVDFLAEVFGIVTESGQNAQPVGYDETYAGASARATQAKERDQGTVAIGIESGIFPRDGKWFDIAIVVVLVPGCPEPIVVESEPFEFPEDCVSEARKRGVETTTVGDVLAERFGCDPTDPHAFLSEGRVKRSDLLAKVIADGLRKIRMN
jgi:non-canonical (house-cleaning) NTP pyrophosphatase